MKQVKKYGIDGKQYEEIVEQTANVPYISFKFFELDGERKVSNILKKKCKNDYYDRVLDFDFKVERGDYELAYVAEDNCPEQDSIAIVLTKINGEQKAPKLMRFSLGEAGKWKKAPTAENDANVKIDTAGGAKPNGCYVLPNKAGVLLVLSKRVFVYNYELTEHKEIFITKINEKALFFGATKSAFAQENNGSSFAFWAGIVAPHKPFMEQQNRPFLSTQYKSPTQSIYPNHASWIVKLRYDLESQEITVTEKSLLLQDEFVCSISEHASDSLLIGCLKTRNLFQTQGMAEVTEIVADDQVNEDKHWLGHFPIPGVEGFMLCAGKNVLSLVSLTEGKMETLITKSSNPYFGQPGVIFPQPVLENVAEDVKPLYMVFSSERITPDNQKQYQIHRMAFQNDFMEFINTIGHLPSMKVSEMIKDKQEMIKDKQKITKDEQEIKDLQKENKELKEKLEANQEKLEAILKLIKSD